MNAPPNRIFTPARIVALVLIALFAGGLAYLRFEPDAGPVSVPAGAKSGDLILHGCDYATEEGSYAADCGTLVVPENRADPQSRLIALPVTRIRARSNHPAEPIFRLEGGPGLTNMEFPDASRFADGHDVVLVGYRGVDGSSVLACPEVESSLKHSTDLLGDTSNRERADAFRSCADRLTGDGVDLAGYSLPQRVDDLEAARVALGYDRVDLVSESAGTRTAMIYSWRYPKSIHRSVMIGANPPGHFLWDAKTTGEQIRRYAALCAQDADCKNRTPDLAASLHSAFGNVPGHWGLLPIKEGNVQAGAFFGLMNATTDGAGPLSAPMTIDTLLAAGQGDGSGAWFMSLMAELAFPSAQEWGDVAAVGRTDAAAGRRFFAKHADRGSVIGSPGTDLVWAGGRLLDAWPASPDENEYTRVRTSKVETLVVSGALDFATPPQWATRELLPHLPNGRQVLLANLGHTDDFWTDEPAASSQLVNTFLDSGRVDDSRYATAKVDFTPTISHGAIAKMLLGVMLGLAALMVLSLVWMARRVRSRGRFGRKAGAALRSVYPVVLGLGGWFLGVLVVSMTMPSVALDDALLAVLSVGVPVGLGIYYAWVDRDRSIRTRTAGIVAATTGALIGAWLGFSAITGIAALLTAIVGAAVGANLFVLALDIARDRSARGLAAATPRGASVPAEA